MKKAGALQSYGIGILIMVLLVIVVGCTSDKVENSVRQECLQLYHRESIAPSDTRAGEFIAGIMRNPDEWALFLSCHARIENGGLYRLKFGGLRPLGEQAISIGSKICAVPASGSGDVLLGIKNAGSEAVPTQVVRDSNGVLWEYNWESVGQTGNGVVVPSRIMQEQFRPYLKVTIADYRIEGVHFIDKTLAQHELSKRLRIYRSDGNEPLKDSERKGEFTLTGAAYALDIEMSQLRVMLDYLRRMTSLK